MNRPEVYHQSVDALVLAYLSGTLEYTDHCACAVGNIIAAANDYKIEFVRINMFGKPDFQWLDPNGEIIPALWGSIHTNGRLFGADNPEGEEQLKSTGYTIFETANIEAAFKEGWCKECLNCDRAFNGLMSVVDCLDRIHENTDAEITETAKKKFDKSLLVASNVMGN